MIQTLFIFLRFLPAVITRKPAAILLLLGYLISFGLLTVHASAETRVNAKALSAMQLASQNLKKDNYDVAIKFATTAIRLNPKELDAYFIRGVAHANKRQYTSAIKNFTYMLRRNPKHFSKVYYYRGDCFVAMGLLKMGIKDYTSCLKYNPKAGKVWYYKACALALAGKTTEALQTIQRGFATKTHHRGKLEKLREAILSGDKIPYHAPCSN